MPDDLDIKRIEAAVAALTEALKTQDKAAIQRNIQALSSIPGAEKGGEGSTITVGDISGSTGIAIGQQIEQVINQYDLAPELASQLEKALAAFTEAAERQQEAEQKRQRRNRLIGLSAGGVLIVAAVVAGIVLGTGGNLQPAVGLPLPVAVVESAGCEATRESIVTSLDQVEDVVIVGADSEDGEQLRIDLVCDGSDIETTVQFPAVAAYPLDYLDEPPTLSVQGSREDAAEFAQAAAAYASGDYALAYFYLSGDPDPNPDQILLAAQALMHMVNMDTGDRDWANVREVYTQVIEYKQPPVDLLARAYAGRGLSYVLEVHKAIAQGELDNLEELKEVCVEQARADFDQAIDLQPDRAWWWASRPLVEMQCSLEYLPDVDTMQADVEQAVTLSEGDNSRDEALARSTLAVILTVYADKPNYSRAETLSQAANQIDPTLALPYAVLSCISLSDDPGAARRLYQDYIDRLYTPWQQAQAKQNLRNQAYCP